MATREEITPVGAEILEALGGLRDALEAGVPLETRFTVRTYKLDLTPSDYGPDDVKRVRASLAMSQGLFARFLGVSPGTVKAWELGTNGPSPIARRFMDEVAADPGRWMAILVERGHFRQKGPREGAGRTGALDIPRAHLAPVEGQAKAKRGPR